MKPSIRLPANPDWKIDKKAAKFTSPPSNTQPPDSELWFTTEVRNGSLSASVTPMHGEMSPNMGGYEFCECAFMFRRTQDSYYFAGIGGFGRKYFIATAPQWNVLNEDGRVQDLKTGQTYNLRVEFSEDHIKLFEGNVLVLSVRDGAYTSGICGIRTNSTHARFEKVDIAKSTHARFEKVDIAEPSKKCFVVMPFKQGLDNVYRVIQETVEEQGIECLRADQRHVSTPIYKDIENLIKEAKLVIVDLTDKNPNVYFEAGLATAWGKPLIFLSQSAKDLAFDVQHMRTITYSNAIGGEKKLKEDLKRAVIETLASRARNEEAPSN
jgi:hypothetical protein